MKELKLQKLILDNLKLEGKPTISFLPFDEYTLTVPSLKDDDTQMDKEINNKLNKARMRVRKQKI